MDEILSLFSETYKIQDLLHLCNRKGAVFSGLRGSSKALFVSSLFRIASGCIIVVTRSNKDASDLYGDLTLFLGPQSIHLFPSRETLPYDDSEPYREIVMARVLALDALASSEKGIYVLPVRTFIDFFMPVAQFRTAIFTMEKQKEFDFATLETRLIELGYEREDRVSYSGCYSIRGDILDIFPYGNEHPFRVEFYGDSIESIREFSPFTQRSLKECQSVRILPVSEIFLTAEGKRRLEDHSKDLKPEVLDLIAEQGRLRGMENYVSVFFSAASTIADYTDGESLFLFDSFMECRNQAEFIRAETEKLFQEKRAGGFLPPPEKVVVNFDSLVGRLERYAEMTGLVEHGKEDFDFEIQERRGYRGQIRQFKNDLDELLSIGYTILVGASYEGQTNRLRELLKEQMTVHQRLNVLNLDMHEGFVSRKMKLAVILDREIFSRKKRYSQQFLEVKSRPIEGILDLGSGDYIVHVEHGIGIYRGIEKLTTGGTEKDFFKIEYRDGDEIFIPVDQINLLQKYIGQEGRIPRIDRLGSDTWKRVKEHVKKSVKNLARELIELYSVRSALRGFAFSRDTEWQFEFESGFRYEETPDQVRTIEELKRDMENERPMDRLVCGDVGFGKTEVAIRASFKAVMDSKQVAVLVPTTILAEQHLNTFKERFALYPVNVEMLSRFKTPREQKIIVENLKNGIIDVVIGTHRLIQKDVQFKELGLVIIDEEQRFGVEHKEKLKQLRKLVDVITMTATPIPRTLYMSLTKIRDMSVIETPPRDRVPIETYVMEQNDEVIIKAIRREIERGGQVYYVHNRVKTIDEKALHLRELMPEISIQIAHGQMDEQELERIMKEFYEMQFELLVTTTIIESGLDIPNVNTIIIERADRFGLSQLYQLRGRVGRSRRKAYAYLMCPPGRLMTEQAEKRLMVINDHTELGAGFAIALKDLELRGAGNILGREQHGDILAVGFEMYVKLLDEAIRELKEGEGAEREIDPVLDVRYKGFIPKGYIESEKLRIEIYKRLAGVRKKTELDELREEVVDRYGPIPSELDELFNLVRLKILARKVGVKMLREKEDELQLIFEKSKVDILSLIAKIHKNKKLFSISPRDYNTLHIYRHFGDSLEKFEFLKGLFEYDENT